VTEDQLDRPQLAIVISIYELIAGLLSLAAVLLAYAFLAMRPGLPHAHSSWWSTVATWLAIVLSFSAAFALWRMHRSAFFLFTAKFLLGLGLFIFGFYHPRHVPIGGVVGTNNPPQRTLPNKVNPPPHPRSLTLGNEPPRRPSPIDPSLIVKAARGVQIFFLLLGASFVLYTYLLLIKQKLPEIASQSPAPSPSPPRSSWPPPPQ